MVFDNYPNGVDIKSNASFLFITNVLSPLNLQDVLQMCSDLFLWTIRGRNSWEIAPEKKTMYQQVFLYLCPKSPLCTKN